VFHLQNDYGLLSCLGLGEISMHSFNKNPYNNAIYTCTKIIKIAWNSRLIAKPYANQKNILSIAEIISMAHTSIEKVPSDFCYFMSLSWEM
jgi:hypothetical protein